MKVKNLEITEIRAVKVDSKNRKVTLKILFSNDTPLSKEIVLEEDFQGMTDKLLKWIKQIKREQDNDMDDNILGGISIVNIKNDEDVIDRAPKGFYRLDQRLDGVKGIRSASEYIKAYGQLLTMEEIIFKK